MYYCVAHDVRVHITWWYADKTHREIIFLGTDNIWQMYDLWLGRYWDKSATASIGFRTQHAIQVPWRGGAEAFQNIEIRFGQLLLSKGWLTLSSSTQPFKRISHETYHFPYQIFGRQQLVNLVPSAVILTSRTGVGLRKLRLNDISVDCNPFNN